MKTWKKTKTCEARKQGFVEKAKTIHGQNFDYSKIDYVNVKTKVKIICLKCYQDFLITPLDHINGHGCTHCKENEQQKSRQINTADFIKKAQVVHGTETFDYSDTVYTGSLEKVTYKCNTCQEYTTQYVANHLSGYGCKHCTRKALILSKTSNKENFVAKAQVIHGKAFEYSEVVYIRSSEKVKIKCNKCKNSFEQIANNHLSGHGCPHCHMGKFRRKNND